jgi:hypothetical protein
MKLTYDGSKVTYKSIRKIKSKASFSTFITTLKKASETRKELEKKLESFICA